jgi:NADPH2:quinone reductase
METHADGVDRVYPFGEAGEALRHLIGDRPFGKVVLAKTWRT